MTIYSMKQWEKDGTFSAKPGQQISEEVYNAMLIAVPPLHLPKLADWRALAQLEISLTAGFLMGEPIRHSEEGMLYHAFGIDDSGKYFFLGDMPSETEQPKAERDLQQNITLFEKIYQGKKGAALYASELCELYLMAKNATPDRKDDIIEAIMLTWSAAFVEGVRYARNQSGIHQREAKHE